MPKNRLTDLNVGEVSFVDKGAIGEVFTLMKMEDPDNINPEILKQFTNEQVLTKIKSMSEEEFISIMKELNSKYQEINKGGNDEMNPEQIKEIVQSCLTESMTTVNKNFAAINKSVDELQNKLTEVEKATTKEDPKKCPNCGMPMDQCKCKSGKEEMMQKSLDSLNETISKMADGLGAIGELKTAVENLTKSQEDVTKRLGDLEGQENPSNHLDPDKIQKGAGEEPKKENFWKSIIGTGVNPDQQ